MEKFLTELLGTTDLATYLASFIFALIGAIIMTYYRLSKRNKHSRKSPTNFCIKFFVRDNVGRFIIGFLITFLVFRFAEELMGKPLNMWMALCAGAFNDEVAKRFINMKNEG